MSGNGLWSLPADLKRKTATPGKKRAQPEHSLQVRVAAMLSWMLPPDVPWTSIAHGVFIPGDRLKAIQAGARLKAMGLHRGWPDIHFIFKGRACYMELKAGQGRSPEQKQVHADITAAGGVVRVCKSEEEVVDFLTILGVPMQARLSPADRASRLRLSSPVS